MANNAAHSHSVATYQQKTEDCLQKSEALLGQVQDGRFSTGKAIEQSRHALDRSKEAMQRANEAMEGHGQATASSNSAGL